MDSMGLKISSHAVEELRARRLLELMSEDPFRTKQELCDLMGIGSRNTLNKIIKSDGFQNMVRQLLDDLDTTLAAQLAAGAPAVLDYQLRVGAGEIGDQVRDHVSAGRVVREFLALLAANNMGGPIGQHGQPVLVNNSFYSAITAPAEDVVKKSLDGDYDEIKKRYTLSEE